MHPQTQCLPTQGNACLWNPEFAVRRKGKYKAQDIPVRPKNLVESPAQSIEEFLIFNKPRLQPTQYTYDTLKAFLGKAGEGREPSAVPMPPSDLRKLVLVDDRRRFDDSPDKPKGLDTYYKSLNVLEFWNYMKSTVSSPL